jgi:class 3 adenylate cyclase/tetratricopeptide (TPR) repeat protein
VLCPACGRQSRDTKRFCEDCGTSLTTVCPACGSGVTPGKRFCGNCGQPTGDDDGASMPAELRDVSILFCDLVGYTPIAESTDPEDLREFLSGYFDLSRAIITRHGGVVEKFIGDAVMAVWGVPVAREDDAERSVRAGLELISAVAAYGAGKAIELSARVGVATGRAATLPTPEQGLVVGGKVNTAARIQTAAQPGSCFVDAVTKRLCDDAISFEDAGLLSLKGKVRPEQVFRAMGEQAGVTGRRHASMEAPLIGRDDELRVLTDAFDACAQTRRPRLVVVSGPPGIGKSRLAAEFRHRLDESGRDVSWYSGRCLSYGDGIAFWAIAAIVRRCLGIAADERQEAAAAKFAASLPLIVPEAERDYIGACLSRLLGVDYPAGRDLALQRDQLFAGWRDFLQCLARSAPLVLAIEDAENADDDLLDFLDNLADWARDAAIYVLVLARPELTERRSAFGSGRGRTALSVEPLQPAAMRRLVGALAPALTGEPLASLTARAGGIPLFVLEMVRSWVDTGTLVQTAEGYRFAGTSADIAVPQSLHKLLAARLDALGPRARRLLGIASVVGTSFGEAALLALSGQQEDEVRDDLADLVSRDVLTPYREALPAAEPTTRQAARASYRFTHELMREVAYEMLSRRARKSRHLAVAAHLRATFDNDGAEVAEIVARHYVDALAASPADTDADAIRSEGLHMLVRAAERAQRAGAPGRAAASYARAAELASASSPAASSPAASPPAAGRPGPAAPRSDGHAGDAEPYAAVLWERAARAAQTHADFAGMAEYAQAASRSYLAEGDSRRAARVETLTGRALGLLGRAAEARAVLAEAYAVLAPARDADTAAALEAMASVAIITGQPDAGQLAADALAMADAVHTAHGTVANLYITRGITQARANRLPEATACYEQAARHAGLEGSESQLGWALVNMSDALAGFEPRRAAEAARTAAEHARHIGARRLLGLSISNRAGALLELGDWDDADSELATAVKVDDLGEHKSVVYCTGLLAALRGDVERAETAASLLSDWASSGDIQRQASAATVAACISAALARPAQALAQAREVLGLASATLGIRHETVRWAWPLAARSGRTIGDATTCAELIEALDGYPQDQLPTVLRAERELAVAMARVTAGEPGGRDALDSAVASLRSAGSPYHLGLALTDQAECHARLGEPARELAEEARSIGQRLGCVPLIAAAAACV